MELDIVGIDSAGTNAEGLLSSERRTGRNRREGLRLIGD